MTVELPPLRERPEDIPLLAATFARRWAAAYGRPVPTLAPDLREHLLRHPWPGNVRELENAVHRAVLERETEEIHLDDLKLGVLARPTSQSLAGRPWDEVQKELIFTTLAQVGGNRRRAAQLMGMGERTLRNRLREYREAAQA
jgi:DNA-binding NtrC family response regulator